LLGTWDGDSQTLLFCRAIFRHVLLLLLNSQIYTDRINKLGHLFSVCIYLLWMVETSLARALTRVRPAEANSAAATVREKNEEETTQLK
jgi:hypothetical protein